MSRAALVLLLLAAGFVAACQSNDQATTAPTGPTGTSRPATVEEMDRLQTAIERWQVRMFLRNWGYAQRLSAARDAWDLRTSLTRALANHAAKREFVSFMLAVKGAASTPATTAALGSLGTEGLGDRVLGARSLPGGTVGTGLLPEVNQCAFELPRQGAPPPVSRAGLRWLRGGGAVDEDASPLTEQLMEWIDQYAHDTNPPPVSAETQAWIDQYEHDTNPPPVSQETLDWIAQEEADANPPPVSQETVDWLAQYEHDTNPPPVSEETLDWIAQEEHDTNPPPVSQETLDWIAQEEADANPPPVSQETLDWIDQYEHDTNPPPVSQETLDWIAQDEADANPPPVSQETLDWLAQYEHDTNPPPVSEETQAWLEQYEHDTNPPPVSQETLDWIDQYEHDTNPPPVSAELQAWLDQYEHDTNPPPVSAELQAWLDQYEHDTNPPPISDELQRWLDEHQDNASPAPSSPASSVAPSSPPACKWYIDEHSGGGRIHGEKCGDPTGEWVVEGTYSQGGFDGTQTWTFTIGADGRTGTLVYGSTSRGSFAGVTVHQAGVATGRVTLTIKSDGTAHMDVVEEKRSLFSFTDVGGSGTDVPLPPRTYPRGFDWAIGGNC